MLRAVAFAVLLVGIACGEPTQEPGRVELLGDLPPDPEGGHAGRIDFGRVGIRASVGYPLAIRNGTRSHHEARLSVAGEGYSAPARLALPPGATVPFAVGLRPRSVGTIEGLLQIELPDETLDFALRAEAIPSCLDGPSQIAFPPTVEACWKEPVRTDVRNACDHPIRLVDIELSGEPFISIARPAVPLEMPPGRSEYASVLFQPRAAGLAIGTLRFADDADGELVVELKGEGLERPRDLETHLQGIRPDADRLYVIDDSAAMAPWADRLVGWVQAVEADAPRIDVQAGVTTASRIETPDCEGSGAGGRLLPLDDPRRVLDRADVLEGRLRARLLRPFCSEAPNEILAAAERAVNLTALRDDPDTPLPGDGNVGLRRPEVPLQVVLISAADDASPGALESWIDRFAELRQRAKITLAAILATEDCGPIPLGNRIRTLVSTLGGSVIRLCADPQAGPWALLVHEPPFQQAFPLSAQPADHGDDREITEAEEGFSVRIDGLPLPQVLPDGRQSWVVDPATPAVIFTNGLEPDEGQSVEFEYLRACR